MTGSQEVKPEQRLDFYISYAGKDRLWAEWIGAELKNANYRLSWTCGTGSGRQFILSREAALRRADRVLALCSAAYFGGGFTEQDWTAVMAAQDGKSNRLIPVWIRILRAGNSPSCCGRYSPSNCSGLPWPKQGDGC